MTTINLVDTALTSFNARAAAALNYSRSDAILYPLFMFIPNGELKRLVSSFTVASSTHLGQSYLRTLSVTTILPSRAYPRRFLAAN